MKNIKSNLKSNQIMRLVALLVVVFSINLFSMRMEKQSLIEEKETETRNVLIFLDDSEKELGGMGGMVLTGLCLKNYPTKFSSPRSS